MGTVIRPPSEANAIILQVSLGCSHNYCLFCIAYKDKRFTAKNWSQILADLKYAANKFPNIKTVFLADGDALALPQELLIKILVEIQIHLPWVKRVNCYASPKSLIAKSHEQLIKLRSLNMKRLYMGVESGSDKVLSFMCKGATRQQILAAGLKANNAKFYLSCSIILGLGGKKMSTEHAKDTASLLSEMSPHHIAALTLMVPESSLLFNKIQDHSFKQLTAKEILQELIILITHLEIDKSQFHANHASNHLPISGQLGRDKEVFIKRLKKAIAGNTPLIPEYMRSL
ncbi:MAG: radical SAM protein [Desulfotalea sp.]